jgi:DMSO/TMAO reductase YedYZ molybdopterin-dependent catalytic subunit
MVDEVTGEEGQIGLPMGEPDAGAGPEAGVGASAQGEAGADAVGAPEAEPPRAPQAEPPRAPEPEPELRVYETRHTRRRFLLVGGAFLAGIVGVLELLRRAVGSGGVTGGAARSVDNLFSSFPINAVEAIPNKTWEQWTLKVDGLVDKPLTLDATAWRALPRFAETADFHCVEGWSVPGVKWGGVTPATVLKQAQARPEGTYLVFHAYTGEYLDSIPLDLALDPQTVLADTMDGVALPAKHGGPLRLVVPKQLGYKSVKWVTRIEVTDAPVQGYWEHYGYPSNAPI